MPRRVSMGEETCGDTDGVASIHSAGTEEPEVQEFAVVRGPGPGVWADLAAEDSDEDEVATEDDEVRGALDTAVYAS